MKKIVFVLVLMLASLEVFSQNTIKFLGIPITGTKKEMIAKLEAKGYEYNSYGDYLTGEFNGQDVQIAVQTVNNRVWRIAVIDATGTNETNIKIRYNNLYDQFVNNGKYISVGDGRLSENVDISYDINVKNKRFEADFALIDTSINGQVWYMIAEQYGSYRIVMFYENLDNAANGDDL